MSEDYKNVGAGKPTFDPLKVAVKGQYRDPVQQPHEKLLPYENLPREKPREHFVVRGGQAKE